MHRRGLPGTPDIVLPKYRSIVFVHGCLWHGHIPCAKHLPPMTRREYWIPKIRENRRRDARQKRKLRRLGWRVFVVWECQIAGGILMEAKLGPLLDRSRKRRRRSIAKRIYGKAALATFTAGSLARRIRREACRAYRTLRSPAEDSGAQRPEKSNSLIGIREL